jgi:pimeloyl-ACP methyl ester carboxylesterase
MRNGMKRRFATAAFCIALATGAQAAPKTTFVQLGPGGMQAMIYEPAERGPKAHIALLTIHPHVSYLNHSSCANMAERGYTVICANTPYATYQYGYPSSESLFPTITAAIARVKQVPGVDKIVLIGHSAGAPLVTYYQNIAQNGAKACNGPEKLMPCDEKFTSGLPPADAIVLLDPHMGDGFTTTTYVDPAIQDDHQPGFRTAAYDMYAKQNGYDPEKGATYTAEFRKTFLAAQAARNAKLIADAQKQYAAIKAKAPGYFTDDMPFIIPGGASARLWQPDVTLFRNTKKEYRLLKADGSMPVMRLTSVRVPSDARGAIGYGSVVNSTVKSFLADHAVRLTADYNQTGDDIVGVDWDSSTTSTISNIRGVTAPLLIEVMTGHYFLQSGEKTLEAAGSTTKEMVGIEGASHGLTPCVPCGSTPTQFGDTMKRAYDYMDGWLAKQF